VFALAALNLLGAVAFGSLYATAAQHLLTQAAFLAGLVVVFVAITSLWVHVERSRGPGRDPLSRAGRIAVGLVLAVIAVPGIVLMPLFWLDTQLPPEAGLRPLLAPVMAIVLISLVLVVVVNLVGSIIVAGCALAARGPRPPR